MDKVMVASLSADEVAEVKRVFNEVARERKKLTMFRSTDRAYARFRNQAMAELGDITVRHVAGIPLSSDNKAYITVWCSDALGGVGDLFRAFYSKLEQVTGKELEVGDAHH